MTSILARRNTKPPRPLKTVECQGKRKRDTESPDNAHSIDSCEHGQKCGDTPFLGLAQSYLENTKDEIQIVEQIHSTCSLDSQLSCDTQICTRESSTSSSSLASRRNLLLRAVETSTLDTPPVLYSEESTDSRASCHASEAVLGWFEQCRGCALLTGGTLKAQQNCIPFCSACSLRLQTLPATALKSCTLQLLQIHLAWKASGL